jgi:membrane-bound lytic murein transglycosylase B
MLATAVVLLAVTLAHYTTGLVLALPAAGAPAYQPSALARDDIPSLYLHLYQAAAARYGLDWTILAGVGTVECDNGQDPAPSCTVEGALNYAGAGGPAQFLVSTWQRYGVTPSGQGTPDMWNPADAIFSMANYLRASGAPKAWRRAIYAYNHAWWYVADVLAWARRYRAAYGPTGSAARSNSVRRQAPTAARPRARHRAPG